MISNYWHGAGDNADEKAFRQARMSKVEEGNPKRRAMIPLLGLLLYPWVGFTAMLICGHALGQFARPLVKKAGGMPMPEDDGPAGPPPPPPGGQETYVPPTPGA